MNDAASEQLEESLRGHESLSAVDDFNALAKGFIEHGATIKTLQGDLEGKVAIPGEDAKPEEKEAWQIKLGRPETIDGYEVAKPEDWPEALGFDEGILQGMKDVAFKKGISASAFADFANVYFQAEKAAYAELTKSMDENKTKAVEAIKTLWPGDKFAENNEVVKQGVTAFADKAVVPEALGGSQGFKDWLTAKGLTTDPMFNWYSMELSKLIGDDFFLDGKKSGGGEPDILDDMFGKSMPKEKFAR